MLKRAFKKEIMFHLVATETVLRQPLPKDVVIARKEMSNAIVWRNTVRNDRRWLEQCIRDLEDHEMASFLFGPDIKVEKIFVHIAEKTTDTPVSLVFPTTIVHAKTRKLVRFSPLVQMFESNDL